jgi:pimeloyl-ACP methyl ester carboxylesterase
VPQQRNVTLAHLPSTPYQVEYSRYGDPTNTPLILLHSIEYGVSPPKAFLDLAHDKGYCLYTVVRPGFGRTTPTDSIAESAKILNQLFGALNLKDITLIALSTAAPTALKLLSLNHDIKEAFFVNYAFDTKNKIQHIKPVWLRGLLEFGLGSQESFKFAFRMSKGMLKVIGAETFYKKMYQSCEEDLLFLATNQETFEASANLILSAEPNTCRLDLAASFLENPQVDTLASSGQNITSIFGEYTHGISLTPIRDKAKVLGIPFHVIEGTGRNCIYQKPEVFFDIVELSTKTKIAQ